MKLIELAGGFVKVWVMKFSDAALFTFHIQQICAILDQGDLLR
jgi:hypothetical protein